MTHAVNFNDVYRGLLNNLNEQGEESYSRKGEKLTELFDEKFVVHNPNECLAFCRDLSFEYLENEFAFYMSGSDQLTDAMACSKFWERCSDDGYTINSNYGKLLFHDKTEAGLCQVAYAIECLKNSKQSKKAVMTVYRSEHAYISNDNPCTMFLRARINSKNELCLTAYMRSSDVYYGLVYDVPFFVFVQKVILSQLQTHYPGLTLGTYTHVASSLHKYERDEASLTKALSMRVPPQYPSKYTEFFQGLFEIHRNAADQLIRGIGPIRLATPDAPKELRNSAIPKGSAPAPITPKEIHNTFMFQAWEAAANAKCLKKHVGGCLTIKNSIGEEMVITVAHGGVNGPACLTCVREDDGDVYYGDECPSVHAEMKCITFALRNFNSDDFERMTMYVTHGPCDACLKFCDLVGIKSVVYDKPYKTDYTHWPRIDVQQVQDGIARRKS